MKKWPLLLLFIRLASISLVQTSFVPDEYWQSQEIAHHLCFGYGYRTWEWQEGIRSYLLPIFIAGIYKVLQIFSIDSIPCLLLTPRLFMALLTWAGDLSLLATANRLWGPRVASNTAFCLATSWCIFYCGSRPLANTVEMALLAVTFRWYQWLPTKKLEGADGRYLWLGALAAIVRPTAALAWLPLWLADLASTTFRKRLVFITAAAGLTAISLCVLVDSVGHGALLFSPLAFLRHNVLGGVASHYGTSPWHAHLTASLPTLLGLHVVPVLLAVRQSGRPEKLCLMAVLWMTVVYSALPHKEFRFLLSIWPYCALLAGKGLTQLNRWSPRGFAFLNVLLLLTNVPAGLYLGLVHQRGPLDVTSVLVARLADGPTDKATILYLMPCHSTPLYSHLHMNVSTRFLTCEPNLAAVANYTDEADQFYDNPERWLRREYPSLLAPAPVDSTDPPQRRDKVSRRPPSHIVLFESLWRSLAPRVRGFSVCESVFHAHFSERRRGGRLLVLCKDGWGGGDGGAAGDRSGPGSAASVSGSGHRH